MPVCLWVGSDAPIGCMASRACRCVDYERPSEMWPLCKTIFFVKPTFARHVIRCILSSQVRHLLTTVFSLLPSSHMFIHIQEERGELCPGAALWTGSQSAPRSANQENPATVISWSSLAASQYLNPSFTHARLFLFLFFCHFPALFLQLIWQIHTLRLIGQWKQKVNSRRKARVRNLKQASRWHKSAD